jgi:hypothetical protein
MLIYCWSQFATIPAGVDELIELDSITCGSFFLGTRLYIYTRCKYYRDMKNK